MSAANNQLKKKVILEYKCPFCQENVKTSIVYKTDVVWVSGGGLIGGMIGGAITASNLKDGTAADKAEALRADQQKLLREMQNGKCPKCKQKNPWVFKDFIGSTGMLLALLDCLIILPGLLALALLLIKNMQGIHLLLMLAVTIVIDVVIAIWRKKSLKKKRDRIEEYLETYPEDCYPRIVEIK
ncbi:MAG: hypothetical protein K5697_11115 [Lachnospiraceae bacterium]|nr:hypothetical protein [Lachnospiraceae bacterium]